MTVEEKKYDRKVYEDASVLISQHKNNAEIYERLKSILSSPTVADSDTSLPNKFRALFALKNLKTIEAVKVICQAIESPNNHQSALLMHEFAYCLGQMNNKLAIPVLERILRNIKHDDMVRHEAAEALGALGNVENVAEILKEYSADAVEAVRETCQLALEKVLLDSSMDHPSGFDKTFNSVDPAPAFENNKYSIDELRNILIDEEKSLFERYRAMFTLRNIGSVEAVRVLGEGLEMGKSALFRHEIAFVFGQMLHPASVDVLKSVLKNTNESDMVRHECAEALGSIATADCLPILEDYLNDQKAPQVVKESCHVALDMYKHENDPNSFHYAIN